MSLVELPAPAGIEEEATEVCVPCLKEVDRQGWTDEIPLRAGDHVVGVRVNGDGAAELVRSLFADRLVPASSPSARVSLYLAERTDSQAQPLHRVYVGHRRVLRSRSVRRALGAVAHLLAAADAVTTATMAQLEATVLVTGDRAHLLPGSMRTGVVDAERRWARHGLRLVDRPLVPLDPVAGTVTVPSSGVTWTDFTEMHVRELGIADRAEEASPTGCFTIASWSSAQHCPSPAQRLLWASGQVRNRGLLDGGALLVALRQLLPRIGEADLEDRRTLPARLGDFR